MPVACVATGIGLFFLTGCGQSGESSDAQVDPSSPQSYMHDEAFRKDLRDLRVQRVEAEEALGRVSEKMEALVGAKAAELKVSREKALAALKGDPEWASLEQRRQDLQVVLKERRARAYAKVRERLAPVTAKPISK